MGEPDEGVRLAVWSGPRSLSTALMRSWSTRPDCAVVDEPLYAWYLAESGLEHPGRAEIIAAGETDADKVISGLTAPVAGIYYQKHMSQHLLAQLRRDWIASLTNVILVRDPAEVVASYVRSRADVADQDLGLRQQCELFDQLTPPPPVIDAADFLRQPEVYLRHICDHAGITFLASMLHWAPGLRATDGVWAKHWYGAVYESTGFKPYRRRAVDLSGEAKAVAQRALPLYERLYEARVAL